MLWTKLLILCLLCTIIICIDSYHTRRLLIEHQNQRLLQIYDIVQQSIDAGTVAAPMDALRMVATARGMLRSIMDNTQPIIGVDIYNVGLTLQEQERSIMEYMRESHGDHTGE